MKILTLLSRILFQLKKPKKKNLSSLLNRNLHPQALTPCASLNGTGHKGAVAATSRTWGRARRLGHRLLSPGARLSAVDWRSWGRGRAPGPAPTGGGG